MADLTVDFVYPISRVAKIVDGDTMYLYVRKTATINFGFGHIERIDRGDQYIKVRLLNIDTWETRGEHSDKGQAARKFAQKWFDEALTMAQASNDHVWVRTYKDKQGKYGRWLAEICKDSLFNEEDCIAYALRENGHEKIAD